MTRRPTRGARPRRWPPPARTRRRRCSRVGRCSSSAASRPVSARWRTLSSTRCRCRRPRRCRHRRTSPRRRHGSGRFDRCDAGGRDQRRRRHDHAHRLRTAVRAADRLPHGRNRSGHGDGVGPRDLQRRRPGSRRPVRGSTGGVPATAATASISLPTAAAAPGCRSTVLLPPAGSLAVTPASGARRLRDRGRLDHAVPLRRHASVDRCSLIAHRARLGAPDHQRRARFCPVTGSSTLTRSGPCRQRHQLRNRGPLPERFQPRSGELRLRRVRRPSPHPRPARTHGCSGEPLDRRATGPQGTAGATGSKGATGPAGAAAPKVLSETMDCTSTTTNTRSNADVHHRPSPTCPRPPAPRR